MFKKKKLPTTKNLNCLNCDFPFSGHEVFCPNCGQKNTSKKLTFGNFIKVVFAGFFSWDAKFWRTLFPLITKPGKISRDYIEGKRVRYTNPFRFYLTITIIFFLIYGFSDKYNSLKNIDKNKINKAEIDSVKKILDKELDNAIIVIDTTSKKEILGTLDNIKDEQEKNPSIVRFGGDSRLDKFLAYNRKNSNPDIKKALDSLNYEDTLWNRFLFNRAQLVNSFTEKGNTGKEFLNKMLSYGSISLFILLPIFTLFLKLLYIRHKYTYVEHLVFVFHTQTVFFILLTIFLLINIFTNGNRNGLFLLLFLIYLFIAMKRFYQQKYFKTFIKFCILNFSYMIIGTIGIAVVAIASFVLF